MEARYRGGRLIQSEEYELPRDGFGFNRDFKGRNGHSRSQEKLIFPKQLTLLIVVAFVGITFFFVKYMDARLPVALNVADIPNNPTSFIEERARHDLALMTSLGPRVCGSHANDIAAVDILTRTLKEIQRTASPVHSIEIDFSKTTGTFNLMDFLDGLTSSYASVPLLTVKFQPAEGHTSSRSFANNSVLVNCHFDSVPVSPGASDDMISCVTMIESLRVLSRKQEPLRNTIIFLFNGAEENGLQASHGFIAGTVGNNPPGHGHPWSKNIRTFFNMEACGAGGREVLFQTGPGNAWLVKAYANSAPYPFGSAMGEEIFQSGIIPSDTDFRIFRDYAKIPGLDVAFIKNGWVYHTRHDNIDQIPPGSLQHVGSNSLAIIGTLGNMDFAEVTISKERMVYFDLFGLVMITYAETTGIAVNLVVAIVTIVLAFKDVRGDKSQLGKNVAATIGAWLAGILSAVLVAVLLNVSFFTMPYYANPSYVFLIFGIPTILGQVLGYSCLLKGAEEHSWMGGKTTLALIILATTFFTRATFAITINLVFSVSAWFSSRHFFKDSQKRLLFYLLVGEAFPFAMSMYLAIISTDVFVPIMGRSGSEANPNIFVGVLTAVAISIPGFTGIVPILIFFKKSFVRGATLFYLLVIAFILIGIGRTPYNEKSPMRIHIVNLDRVWFESDLTTVKKTESGFWFFNMDPHIRNFMPSWSEKIPEFDRAEPIAISSSDCQDLYCALPFFFPVSTRVRKTDWIPKTKGIPAELKARVRMEMTQDEFITQSRRRITLSFLGPSQLTIKLSPGPNYDLVKWSLPSEIPKPTIFWKGRPTFFIFHGRGIEFQRFEVTLDFERIASEDTGSPLLDINYSSFFIHGDEMRTDDLKEIISRLPNWTHTLGWNSITSIYSIN